MRPEVFALALLSLTPACGDGTGDDDPDGIGAGGSGGSGTGGTQSGGSPAGVGADASVDDHEAACRSFCDSFSAQCGIPCPETCDGYANTHGEECAGLGVGFFECMAAEGTAAYDCDAGTMQTITDGCTIEQDDLSACRSLDGIACERKPNYDNECTAASQPFAFFCVSTAVPADCAYVNASTYCCPTE